MSHPNITNGASLEDCYTNFFGLADLCGIKWRRLTTSDNFLSSSTDPLEDPILSSYSKCLAQDLLCVWRRIVNNRSSSTCDPSVVGSSRSGSTSSDHLHSNPNSQVFYLKELWIFWYGEEPYFSKLISAELIEVEQGSWENGLSYECRTLLFKALHNLIERCLLSRGFTRLGKWFVQPLDSFLCDQKSDSSSSHKSSTSLFDKENDKKLSPQLTFAFNFFVHGESTVCASVDVRQHSPVYKLSRNNLIAAQGSQNGLNVILSPYGLAGVITGQSFKENDPSAQRLLNEWKRFYPIHQSSKDVHSTRSQTSLHVSSHFHVSCLDDISYNGISDGHLDQNIVPSVIEVIVAGIKMKYPSCYTFIIPNYNSQSNNSCTKDFDKVNSNFLQSVNHFSGLLTPPSTPPEYLAPESNPAFNRLQTPILSPRQPDIPSSSFRIRNNAFQEMNINYQSKASEASTNMTTTTNNTTSFSSTTNSNFKSTSKGSGSKLPWSPSAVSSSISVTTSSTSSNVSTNVTTTITSISATSTPSVSSNNSVSPPNLNSSLNLNKNTSLITSSTNTLSTTSSTNITTTTSSAVIDMIPSLARWDFIDPACKACCNCFRCKSKKSQSSGSSKLSNSSNVQSSNTFGANKKLEKSEKEKQNFKGLNKNINPFHQRLVISNMDFESRVSPNNLLNANSLISTSSSLSSYLPSSCSPSSSNFCPSTTLVASNSSSTLSSSTQIKSSGFSYKNLNGLPSVHYNVKNPACPIIDSSRPSNDQLNYGVNSTSLSSIKKESSFILNENKGQLKNQSEHVSSPLLNNQALSGSTLESSGINPSDNVNNEINKQQTQPQLTSKVNSNVLNQAIKRPMLLNNFHENLLNSSKKLLYDFSSVNNISESWDLPLPKNRRIIKGLSASENLLRDNIGEELNYLNCFKTKDPYEFSEFEEESGSFKRIQEIEIKSENVNSNSSVPNSDTSFISSNLLLHSVQSSSSNNSNTNSNHGEDDENINNSNKNNNNINNLNAPKDTLKANIVPSAMDISSPSTPKAFTREEELKVSYGDLDRIFNSSSDDESNLDFPTPSLSSNIKSPVVSHINGSSSLNQSLDDMSKLNSRNNSSISVLAELTRIFPTPPSMEHNTAPSPCNAFSGTDVTLIDDINCKEKCDIYPSSPVSLESSKDWSYVYKPPVQFKFITSSKYAPLPNIPSLPSIQLPSECLYKPSEPKSSNQPNKNQTSKQTLSKQPNVSKERFGYLHQQPSSAIQSPSNVIFSPMHSQLTKSQSPQQKQFQSPQHQHPSQQMQSHLSMNRMMHSSFSSQMSPASSVMAANNMRLMRANPQLRGNFVNQMHFMGPQNLQPFCIPPQFSNSFQMQNDSPLTLTNSNCNPTNFNHLIENSGSQSQSSNVYHHSFHVGHDSNSSLSVHHPSSVSLGTTSNLVSLPYETSSHQPPLLSGRPHIQDPNSTNPGILDAYCLIVNLVLSDSMLNLFKDHNFESCTLCACNTNIKGSDVNIYLPESLVPSGSDEEQYKCSCGFSAVSNRHRSYFSGLFYEDEIEITGVIYDPLESLAKKPLFHNDSTMIKQESDESKDNLKLSKNNEIEEFDSKFIDILKSYCSTIFTSSCLLSKASFFETLKRKDKKNNVDDSSIPILLNSTKVVTKKAFLYRSNALQRSDSCEIAFMAIVAAKQLIKNGLIPKLSQLAQLNGQNKLTFKASCMHEWPFGNGTISNNNQDVVRFLKNLQPLLQEAVQKKPQGMWEVTYSVSGPLTWRQFHRLAGRGTEDQCEPQPIPSLLVGHDKDWVALSPFALKYWEKLMLEPYSITRDVAYIVVAPDNSYVLNNVKTFFKELSTTYEMHRLGKHSPIAKVMRDGIMRVGKTVAKNIANEPIDEWFDKIGDDNVASKIKLYARAFRYYIAPHLSAQTLDKSLFDNIGSTKSSENLSSANSSGASSTKLPLLSSAPVDSSLNDSKSSNEDLNETLNTSSSSLSSNPLSDSAEPDENPNRQPVIVIYIIEPFTYANMDEEIYRLSCLGLIRCYAQMLSFLPEHLQNSINLQLISLDSVLNNSDDCYKSNLQNQLKALAFSVFNQCRKVLVHQSISKSLTGFGPAASLDLFIKSKDPSLNITKIYTPPYILAPLKDKQTELVEMFGDRPEKSQALYCAYCLTEDQRWIIVTCSNDKGDLLETNLINIGVPNRSKRKRASVKKLGLHKILDFIFTVMTESVQPWRLIIGRVGRVGHGELKEWASLLSKKSLLRYNRILKEKCRQCSMMTSFEIPCILSTCLISLEPDTALRVFPDQFTPDDRFNSSSNTCHLSTPEEASCTHILVFPTSTTTQSVQGQYQIDPLGPNLGDDDLLQALGGEAATDDLGVDDIFQWTEGAGLSLAEPESPRNSGLNQPDSPRQSGFDVNGSIKTSSGIVGDFQDEPPQLSHQPLALGYYVSTAQTGPLPKWFWSSCPHLETLNPVFLKSALLIHTPSVQLNTDDLYPHARNSHPLDSNLTTDVLRYVLEGYNSLSWISLDPATHDRMSCLPIHIQILMQLYHTVYTLI